MSTPTAPATSGRIRTASKRLLENADPLIKKRARVEVSYLLIYLFIC